MNEPISQVNLEAIRSAYKVIGSRLPRTPLTFSPQFSELVGHEIFLKWDNKLVTGSFKERGAINFLLSLNEEERKIGVCGCSAGNHALAVSYHAARLKIPCTMFMPINAPVVKVESTRKNKARIELGGDTFDQARAFAEVHARETGKVFIPPFNDPRIICGQGTAALEVLEELKEFDSAVVSVGGGGYISGIATVLKQHNPEILILGAQSQWAHDRRQAGEDFAPLSPGTIADGIAVKQMGSLTTPIIDRLVDQLVLVSETEIERALIHFLELERTVVEGACAAALAALIKSEPSRKRKRSVIFVGGSNIDVNLLSRLIDRHQQRMARLARLRVSVPDRPGSLALVTANLSASGANILETYHDRLTSDQPRNVDITFLVELRNAEHLQQVTSSLEKLGVRIH